MPPTPPVPAVTITTDPATPIDMPLATGQEQQVLLQFSRSLSWSDFIEYARFAYMYDGVIYSNVSPVTGGSGVRVDGNDGELIINIPEWNVPVVSTNIILEIGHKDWKLLGITYDDRYQLKPQDLIGLSPSNNPGDIVNPLLSGNTVPFVLNNYLISVRYSSTDNKAYYKVCPCNPEENDKAAKFLTDDWVISSYSCVTFNSLARAEEISDFLIGMIGLQPQQLTETIFEGYLSSVPMPLIIYEI